VTNLYERARYVASGYEGASISFPKGQVVGGPQSVSPTRNRGIEKKKFFALGPERKLLKERSIGREEGQRLFKVRCGF